MKISVLVKPGSKKGPLVEAALSGVNGNNTDGVDGIGDGADLIVYLQEKAHDGEANKALVKLLSKYYGVAKSCVVIHAGEKSRKKVVEII